MDRSTGCGISFTIILELIGIASGREHFSLLEVIGLENCPRPFAMLICSNILSSDSLDRFPDREDFDEHESRQKSADVRRISNAAGACRSHKAQKNLITDPESERDIRRDGRVNLKDQRAHAVRREKEHITAEHARDRARCAEHRNDRIGT